MHNFWALFPIFCFFGRWKIFSSYTGLASLSTYLCQVYKKQLQTGLNERITLLSVCLPEGASVHTLFHRVRLVSQISMNLRKEGQNLSLAIQTSMAVHVKGHGCMRIYLPS